MKEHKQSGTQEEQCEQTENRKKEAFFSYKASITSRCKNEREKIDSVGDLSVSLSLCRLMGLVITYFHELHWRNAEHHDQNLDTIFPNMVWHVKPRNYQDQNRFIRYQTGSHTFDPERNKCGSMFWQH